MNTVPIIEQIIPKEINDDCVLNEYQRYDEDSAFHEEFVDGNILKQVRDYREWNLVIAGDNVDNVFDVDSLSLCLCKKYYLLHHYDDSIII